MTRENLEAANCIYKEIKQLIEIRNNAKQIKRYIAKLEENYNPLESCKFQIGDSQALSFYLLPEIINVNAFIEGYISECDKIIQLKENEFKNL